MAKHTKYDRKVIQKFADKLYAQANFVILTTALAGGAVGAAVGFFAGVPSPTRGTGLWIGGAIGLLVGLVTGIERAFGLKLKAQQALCRADIEFNTRATREIVEQLADANLAVPVDGPVE